MKKKVIATMLVGSMLMMPFTILADEKDNYLHKLSFDKIETEMKMRNKVFESSREALYDSSSDLSENINYMKSLKQSLIDAVNEVLPLYEGEGASYTENMKLTPFETTNDPAEDTVRFAYFTNLSSLLTQISGIDQQIKALNNQDDNIWKSWLNIEQGEKNLSRTVQQIYLGYFTSKQTRDELKSNLDLLESKLEVAKLQESLGMSTTISTLETEAQIKELKNTLEALDKSLENLKGNLNIMLGQDYDTELELVEPPEVTRSMIRDIDYEEDLENALIQSYDVRLAEDSDDIKQAKKEFTFAFHQAYQNVLDKQKALELAREKLSLEQKKYDQNYLMYSLGLIARMDFDGIRSMYRTQVNAVEAAERELLQAYTDYEWMKKGLTVSSSASAGGASSGASAGAPSGASSMQSSGMGF